MKVGEMWKLIDLDAAAVIGCAAGLKYSSGYAPPELVVIKNGVANNYYRAIEALENKLKHATQKPLARKWRAASQIKVRPASAAMGQTNVKHCLVFGDFLEIWSTRSQIAELHSGGALIRDCRLDALEASPSSDVCGLLAYFFSITTCKTILIRKALSSSGSGMETPYGMRYKWATSVVMMICLW